MTIKEYKEYAKKIAAEETEEEKFQKELKELRKGLDELRRTLQERA